MIPATRGLLRVCYAALAASVSIGLAGCEQQSGVVAKEHVNDYSWLELSEIAGMIAGCLSDDDALSMAVRYHLAADDGRLDGLQEKEVELADGRVVHAVVAGFNHDDRADGSKAGITFLFRDAVASRWMNDDAGNLVLSEESEVNTIGGWATSEAREWLNGTFANQLPVDLKECIVSTEKAGISVPQMRIQAVDLESQFAEQVPQTMLQTAGDILWLPSVSELSNLEEARGGSDTFAPWDSLLALEGNQYKLFIDTPDYLERRADTMPHGSACWLRTPTATSFATVSAEGKVDRHYEEAASQALGMMPGFCV